MALLTFFPQGSQLQILHLEEQTEELALHVQTTAPTAPCPHCGLLSDRVHSRYTRHLNDLPFTTKRVRLLLTCRRFFCANAACPRRTFAEPLPQLTVPYARTTTRLDEAHRHLAFALGGEAGARLAAQLAMPVSPDTLLRRLRRAVLPTPAAPTVVGIDDWALRKGQRYGTIVCDLQRHQPIDLLPERSADSVAAWLQKHPTVQTISRDRGDEYIRGATQGAPAARQVADRFHLIKNVREALQRGVDRLHAVVRQTAQAVSPGADSLPALPVTDTATPSACAPSTLVESRPSDDSSATLAEAQPTEYRSRSHERYQHVHQLHAQGLSGRAIARRLEMDRGTVRRYLQAQTFPERAQRRTSRRVDRFTPFLRQRWEEGCHNASQLTEEIREQGFDGSYYLVRRLLARWRPNSGTASACRSPPSCPSARQVSWWLLQEEAALEEEERAFVQALQERSDELKASAAVARAFAEMVRERQVEKWDGWLAQVNEPGIAKELRTFAQGLKEDEAAVKAALEQEWSNGQVEGQINRLKTLKRQMYGRAGFELLRKRFLYAG